MEQSKKTILALIVVSFIALSSSIFAQDYWCNDDLYGSSWWNTNLSSEYQLSSDQIAEINKYRKDISKKIFPLQKELRALQIELRGYVNRNDADPDKIKDYRNQIREIQDEIADLRINARKKISSVFTDEQQTYFNNSRVGWWDNFYERCGWNYDDLIFDDDYGYKGRERSRWRCW